MKTATVTYRIAGSYVTLHVGDDWRVLAKMPKATVRRSFNPETVQAFQNRIGFNEWRWLGIIPDYLPHGVNVGDVWTAYQIAHDEMEEAGVAIVG